MMNWITDFTRFRHDMFIVFIECKIEGKWDSKNAGGDISGHQVLYAVDNSEGNLVYVIEPDGLRRIFHFNQGATISKDQNILSYVHSSAHEIVVDEKEQAGKGKTRDKL